MTATNMCSNFVGFRCSPPLWVAVAVHQQTFFIQVLDLCSNPIFGSSLGRTSITVLPTSVLNSESHTQQHILDANDNCICICLSDWHQTNISHILSSPCPPNVCKVQAVQCCSHQCLRKPWVLHKAFFQFLNPSDKKELSDLAWRWSSPFKFAVAHVWHYRIWNWKVMQPWKLRVPSGWKACWWSTLVWGFNWLVWTLGKGSQSWGYSTDSRFLHLRNTKSYLYTSYLLHTHATSAWVIKVHSNNSVWQYIIV